MINYGCSKVVCIEAKRLKRNSIIQLLHEYSFRFDVNLNAHHLHMENNNKSKKNGTERMYVLHYFQGFSMVVFFSGKRGWEH